MSVKIRNNVTLAGDGPATVVFAHGFGCDQNMWRYVEPAFRTRYRTVLFDLVGCGRSDLSAYDVQKYSSLDGYAHDIIEIIERFGEGPVLFVGHSVSSMAGVLASNRRSGLIDAHIMIGPSPCYINDDSYCGGFSAQDIDSLLETLESNYLGWSSAMAPVIMGAPEHPEYAAELTNSFCKTDPDIAKRFARVTFLSDLRKDVARLREPTLVVQSSEDFIAPMEVGQYLVQVIPEAHLAVVENVGHCPHLSAPEACIEAMSGFLAGLGRPFDVQ
ncbi:alpha/beta hydrolase [Pseudomonas sp. dw_358]|uniref:alpha/beta fold hydrolase n=1 Tax=Pseudomonas sp. dw_358 TaxID=2720083 RepID=UPI001BD41BDF|nr:alpha/beta hydrolase [Pseudomonas sp. dw_358]